MFQFRLTFIRPFAAIVTTAFACSSIVMAQAEGELEKALDRFFELGLPDTKPAKWVNATRANPGWQQYDSGDENDGPSKAGNAWLLSEKNGAVELLFSNGNTAKGRRASKAREGQSRPGSDEYTITPAKLEDDLKTFAKKFKAKPNRNNRSGEESNQNPAAGGALIFLAQLQRHGETAFVRENLPTVLGMMDSPAAVLESALDILANLRMSGLPARWYKDGVASDYATAIESISSTFTRGWTNRDAALFLAKKLRAQKPAPAAGDADAKQAADLLLSLTEEETKSIPSRNWFLDSGENGDESDDAESNTEPAEPARKKDSKPDRVEAFFAKKREAAAALAKLLGDERYLRTELQNRSNYESSFSFGEEKTPEQKLKEAYNRLARPRELGEVAMTLLSQILPDSVTETASNPAAKHAAISAWIANAASQSDEQIAWEFLRGADSTYDDEFRTGLGFLVKNGNPETMAKLKEVFLDPGVWKDGTNGNVLQYLSAYIKKGTVEPDFEAKLKSTLKLAFEQNEADQAKYDQSASRKKQFAAQRTAANKQIEALFKGSAALAEQFSEIAAMDEKEALIALNAQQQGMMQKSVADVEAPALIAAAKSKSAQVKSTFLQIIASAGGGYGMGRSAAPKTPPPALTDAAAIEAALALLADETLVSNRWDPGNSQPLSAIAAGVIISVHSDAARQSEWQTLGMKSARVYKKVSRIHAEAILKKQPPPAMPNAASIAADKVQSLFAEIGALPAGQIAAALDSKTPDEQLALAEHLSKVPEWPASLVAAHFTVTKSDSDKPGALGDPKWVGKRFDEAFVNEIRDALTKSVREEKPLQISVTVGDPLAGVTVSIVSPKSQLRVDPKQFQQFALPGLDGKPAPFGLAGVALMNATQRERAMVNFPIWKEEAPTNEWREKHGKAVPTPDEPGESARNNFPTNPAKFEQSLREYLSLKPAKRGAFRLTFYSAIISDKKAENENEDDE